MHRNSEDFDLYSHEFIQEFSDFVRFPSLSSDSQYLGECKKCADFLMSRLDKLFSLELWEKEGHPPIIYAKNTQAGPGKPTLLLYNHYDVQPAELSDGWEGDPFILRQKNGRFYARGASDNKGQCFYTLKALQHYYNTRKCFPVNLIWLIEGEEESGSPALFSLIEEKRDQLKADAVLIIDGGFTSEDYPSLCIGSRGLLTMKVHVQEGTKDMHSGTFGGIAYNVNRALAEILSSLHNSDNSIAIEHFYDDITPIPRDCLPDTPASDMIKECEKTLGFHPTGYEPSYTPEEAGAYRPALDINGISGGYTGPGFKAVIPYRATAYLSCRLVPGQDPKKIATLVINHLQKRVPKALQFSYEILESCEGWRSSPHLPLVEILKEIYSKLYHKECLKLLMTATIPIAPTLGRIAGAEPIVCGTSYISDNIHAAEENFSLDQFRKGFLSICQLLDHLA
ncbi:putative peptidase [Chlamydia pecorum PV3056/3]|uniref:M20/M25/M40 family metallo-hydrolase n=1 Tax=Chlamydia pecorum TaxID=85991 RepID=UPI0003AE53EB|nr:M20/M25/M40 family metallo-hydrolase [Chlamydia pecorum]AGW38229.1 putative peptidase [Chlamydia pecorum PV3056/3]KZN27264.1 peptidase M20/M25/M40 family protein [Chlamydia pecorum]